MASVELNINGRFYSIACDAGEEERVAYLGRMVDAKARQIGPAANDTQRFLMACLMLADELDEAKAGKANGSIPVPTGEDHDLLVAAVEHLAERIDHIANSLNS